MPKTPPPDSAAAAIQAPPEGGGLPIFFTVGLGYGQRFDRCAYCASTQNIRSFTGHVSLGKYVAGGLGVGVDVTTASGMGVGYSLGGGATLPLASLASLVLFVNWNVGSYDLATPAAVLERGVKHKFVELGFGLTVR